MGAPPLPLRLAAQLHASSLLRPGERVLVALSGGLDSVCLLHLLRFTLPAFPLQLHAAHYDHALRPDSADDAAWVSGLCRAWGVPLTQARATAAPRGEAAARALRYAFLDRVAGELGVAAVVTAHHADDQLETLLFRLARGTGLAGLRGIPARRGLLMRPLLPFRRAELLAYARAVGLGWREDASNVSPAYARNRIRHVVLPALEAAWPDAAARLLRLADLAAVLENMWQHLLPELVTAVVRPTEMGRIELARGVLQEYHPQARARVMRLLAHRLGSPLGRAGTRAAVAFTVSGESGTGVRLGPHLRLDREFDRLVLSRSGPDAQPVPDLPVRIESAQPGTARARIGSTWFQVSWGPLPPAEAGRSSASFDPSALHFPLELRGWLPGDRIRLASGTKKLKKLFGERRVPRSRRGSIPVLAEQGSGGGVLWIAGVARVLPAAVSNEWWHITVSDGESA